MQAVVALPGTDEVERGGGIERALFRKVCGIPLLARVVATACRSGCTEVILLHPAALPEAALKARLKPFLCCSVPVHTVALKEAFHSDSPSDWQAIESRLDAKFLWLPWNIILEKNSLRSLIAAAPASDEGAYLERLGVPSEDGCCSPHLSPQANSDIPAVVVKEKLKIAEYPAEDAAAAGGALKRYLASPRLQKITVGEFPSAAVCSSNAARRAEVEIVRRSGKESDGIYSRWNRWLCRPAVRWLSKTPITPNMVTFGGLGITVLSAYWFAQGHWSAYLLGAGLYFLSVLFDEMDGMLARVTFRDSAFGTWLESFVDYASYLLLFLGMTIGLYRENGAQWLWMGGLMLLGTLTSILVLSRQRKLATDPQAPHEYRQRLHRQLEADSGNIVSRLARQLEFLVRKPAYCYYVVIFTLLGATKLLLFLTAFGANVVWILALSFNRFFRLPASEGQPLKVGGNL